jgi:hypothetical protein
MTTYHKGILYSSKGIAINESTSQPEHVSYIGYPKTTQTLGNDLSSDGVNPYMPIEIGFSDIIEIGFEVFNPSSTITIPYPHESNVIPPYNLCDVEGMVFKNSPNIDIFRFTFPLRFNGTNPPFPTSVNPTFQEFYANPSTPHYLKNDNTHQFYYQGGSNDEYAISIKYKDDISTTTVALMAKITLI